MDDPDPRTRGRVPRRVAPDDYADRVTPARSGPEAPDRQERILDAVLRLLAQQGIAGVSIRAVAREAGVALGLVNYYYEDKVD